MRGFRPLIVVLIFCPACSMFEERGEMNKLAGQQSYWLEMDATRRAAYVAPGSDGKGLRVLAEPAPDAMLSRAVKLLLEASSDGSSASGKTSVDLAETAAELTQAETVKFLREALYRISELSFNGVIEKEEVLRLYTEATVAAIALAQAKYAKPLAELLKREAEITAELEQPGVTASSDRAAELARIRQRIDDLLGRLSSR